ncbi:MAG TPA: bifunctional helix-turn-helix transcriptional regulator/GNAT family N-acetyltransferase [Kofleriaceae bacterium]|nr:bifunctional helix-turn-helix transcriptional regulator/GNAT family N-acetyltransferase [Kofleriaceae bacterium]
MPRARRSSRPRRAPGAGRDPRIAAVRAFNRFYTARVGALGDGLLDSQHSLAEVRVLYELAHRDGPAASEITAALGLDRGYLSRILRRLERAGLVARRRSTDDARRSVLRLTGKGRSAFAELDARADDEIAALLAGLAPADRDRLVGATRTIHRLLAPREPGGAAATLRGPRPGELGWVVHRHGALYAAEYGWDERFEGLVAGVVASFAARRDPARERCWIAERDGEPVGSVFLVAKTATVAQLRLLLVEPSARGLGIGARLVDECTAFARAAGYRSIVLWTNDVLHAARRIYQAAGYRLVDEAPHQLFGEGLVGQTWELSL